MGIQAAIGLLAGATIVDAVDSRKQRKRAESKAEELKRAEQAQASDQAARSRRQQIREARIAQAQQANLAAASDMTGGSAVIAAQSGVMSQANEGIGQINTTLGYSSLSARLQNDIFNLQQPTNTQLVAGTIGSLAQGAINTGAVKRK